VLRAFLVFCILQVSGVQVSHHTLKCDEKDDMDFIRNIMENVIVKI